MSRLRSAWGALALGGSMALAGCATTQAPQEMRTEAKRDTALAAATACYVMETFLEQSRQKIEAGNSGVHPTVTPCHAETDPEIGGSSLVVGFDYNTRLTDRKGHKGELDELKGALCIRAIEISAAFMGDKAVEAGDATPVMCVWHRDPTTSMEVSIPMQPVAPSGSYRQKWSEVRPY